MPAPGPISQSDRLAAWQQPPGQVAQALLQHVGVVAHLPAGRLDRALMRLELALAPLAPPTAAALAVLAAVDVLVVMNHGCDTGGPARVRGIYELVMSAEGYRPAPLFASGLGPVPEALVPQRQPSFAADLEALGHRALVADWAAAVPAGATRAPSANDFSGPGTQGRPSATAGPSVFARALMDEAGAAPRPPRARTGGGKRPASAPGWELDQESGSHDGPGLQPGSLSAPATEAAPSLGPSSFAAVLAGQTDAVVGEGATEDSFPAQGAQDVQDAMDAPMALEPPPRPR